MNITKEKFDAFLEVRDGGQTNMWDTIMVSHLSDNMLSPEEVVEIIKNFSQLAAKYGDTR